MPSSNSMTRGDQAALEELVEHRVFDHIESVHFETYELSTGHKFEPVAPSGPKLHAGSRPGSRPTSGAVHAILASSPQSRPISGGGGKNITLGNVESVSYDTIHDGVGHNADSDAYAAIGIGIKEHFSDMQTAFHKLDLNKDGRVSKQELLKACREWNIAASEAERVVSGADTDSDGMLDFNEFVQHFNPFMQGDFSDKIMYQTAGTDGTRANNETLVLPAIRSATPEAQGSGGRAARALRRVADLEWQFAEANGSEGHRQERAVAPAPKQARSVAEFSVTLGDIFKLSNDTTVFVYGCDGDKASADMCRQLKSAEIPYVWRDFDTDQRYQKPLKHSGFKGGKIKLPVICLGLKAWWDETDENDQIIVSYSWAVTVVRELLRILVAKGGNGKAPPPPEKDSDIETEIYERFTNMQEAFLNIDNNQDGDITKSELVRKCRVWNIPISEAGRAMIETDLNRDGALTFQEFAKRFNGTRPSGNNVKITTKGPVY